MAQATNKKVNDWTRLESAKSYLVALSTSTGIPVDRLVNTKLDGANEDRGTWAHRKVAIRFAQWCSDEFAVPENNELRLIVGGYLLILRN